MFSALLNRVKVRENVGKMHDTNEDRFIYKNENYSKNGIKF